MSTDFRKDDAAPETPSDLPAHDTFRHASRLNAAPAATKEKGAVLTAHDENLLVAVLVVVEHSRAAVGAAHGHGFVQHMPLT